MRISLLAPVLLALLSSVATSAKPETMPSTTASTRPYRRASTRPSTRPIRFAPRISEILSLSDNTITVSAPQPPMQDERPDPITYTIDDNTRFFTGELTGERETPTGQRIRSYRVVPSTRAALQPGQRARIDADAGRALRITLMPNDLPPLPSTRPTTRRRPATQP